METRTDLEQGPGTAGAFARVPLARLEAFAREELAGLQRQAALPPSAAVPCPEAATMAWDLGLDPTAPR